MTRAVALLALLLTSCASPQPAFYTLAAIPGTPGTARVRAIELRRVGLAGYLDRPEIVRESNDYRVRFQTTERWAEPLGTLIERVFTENLVQRLPGTSVYGESGAISTRPDLVIEVDILRLDPEAGQAVLLAQIAIRTDGRKDQTTARAEVVRLAAPAGSTTRDLAAAESALLGRLADAVAARLPG